MKYAIWIILFLSLNPAWAAPGSENLKSVLEQQASCGNFVRYDDANLYLGFGPYLVFGEEGPRSPIPGTVHVAPLDGSPGFDLATKDSAIDLVSVGGHAYVLTYSSLEEWDLAKRQRVGEYATYDYPGTLAYHEHAQAMARYQDKLIIAHGRLGVSFFDLKTKRVTRQYRLIPSQFPLESMATGVTVQGNLAYVVMDSFTLVGSGQKPPFQGIVVIDMESETVVAQLGGMDPGADAAVSDGQKLIVSFMGEPLWKYSLGSLSGTQMPAPEYRVFQFPLDGHPSGRPAMDDTYYYTCFLKAPAGHQGLYKPVPIALSRKQINLD